jgi:hypothetical protein
VLQVLNEMKVTHNVAVAKSCVPPVLKIVWCSLLHNRVRRPFSVVEAPLMCHSCIVCDVLSDRFPGN